MMNDDQLGHSVTGTRYGKGAVVAYTQTTHHSDRQRFLSGYIEKFLINLDGLRVIDIGAGTGPWSIYAAQHGATEVIALDYQQDMLDKAKETITKAGLNDKIKTQLGDAAQLNYDSSSLDVALSIQVGCNLPNAAGQLKTGLPAHIKEISRVLKHMGKTVITAPASFGVIFTSGEKPKTSILAEIEKRLKAINIHQDSLSLKTIQLYLKDLSDVNLATFAVRKGKVVLITNEEELIPGEEIWRKLPGLVVPNYYHPIHEYQEEFKRNGLKILYEYNQGFSSIEEREEYNLPLTVDDRLGEEYVHTPPFYVWLLEKV